MRNSFDDPPEGSGAPKRGYGDITTGAIWSLSTARYGYFAARMRASKGPVSSSFWLFADTPHVWSEIDIVEMGGAALADDGAAVIGAPLGRVIPTNPHVFRAPGLAGEVHSPSFPPLPPSFPVDRRHAASDDFHIYALDWSRDSLRWFVDGHLVRSLPNTHWHNPLHLVLDVETLCWSPYRPPAEGELAEPAVTAVDWVRCWSCD